MKYVQETPVERTILNTTETSTSKSKGISKNENTVSALNRGQEENISLFTVISLVDQTMQTLPNWTQLDLSNKSFTKDVYKFLNKT